MTSHFSALCRASAGLVLLSASIANAQDAKAPLEPSVTTATYSDWTLRCVRDKDLKTSLCEVTQTLQMQGQTAPVAQIAVGRPAQKAPLRLTIILPINVAFDKGPQMQVEEQPAQAASLGWRRCANFGCVADVEVKAETLNAWRVAAKPGQIMFRNAGNQDVALPFSFRGLAQALDAMAKS
jgi:invasion protein IalB